MKKAGSILALISGILGFFAALVTLGIGGLGQAFDADGMGTVTSLGWGGVIFSILVIVFSSIAISSAYKAAGITLLITAILGAVLGGSFVAIVMVLAIIGALLSIFGTQKSDVPMQTGQKVTWVIVWLLLAGTTAVLVNGLGTHEDGGDEQDVSAQLNELIESPVSDLEQVGELASIYAFGSDHTDLQRERKTKEIKGNVVQWKLPVYEVTGKKDGSYLIHTDTEASVGLLKVNVVGTNVYIKPRDDRDRATIEGLKTGSWIHIKGIIQGETLRNLDIKPAILIYDEEQQSRAEPVEQTIESSASSSYAACVENMMASWHERRDAEVEQWCADLAAEGEECRISAGQAALVEEEAQAEAEKACHQS